MPNILWNETSPADTDPVSSGDDEIRSLKTSIRNGLDAEHIWPSTGGDAGVHRLGSARPYFAAQSLVSSSGTDGKLMVTSDTSNLFHVGSGGTMFLGGQRILAVTSQPTGGQRFYWAAEFGVDTMSASPLSKTFPNSGFSGVPVVVVSVLTSDTTTVNAYSAWLSAVSDKGFTVQGRLVQASFVGAASALSITWLSIGTRTL